MKLGRRDRTERPGLIRTARVDRRVDHLVARARPGEIAVIDVIDLDRATAEQLVAAGVSAVVNAAPSCSGRFPVRGPQALLEAGVLLLDDVGGDVFSRVRDGDTVRVDGSAVFVAGEQIVAGQLQSDESVAASGDLARAGLRTRLGALVADAGRRLERDDGRLLEGDTFPSTNTDFTERVVVVVTASSRPAELHSVRKLVRRRGAVVVAVGAGADLATAARIRPDLVVVGRTGARPGSLTSAREVLVLDGADLDLPVPAGIPRGHAASMGSPEDTAILLAHTRGAALVVTCGIDESLGGVLDRSVASGSVPLIGRLRGGGRHVASTAADPLLGGRGLPVRWVPAVLLAAGCLVVGALIGVGPLAAAIGDQGVSASGRSEQAGEQPAASDGSTFEAAAVPALVGGRLTGHVVAVVALPGAAVPPGLVRTVQASGAAVTGPLVLGPDYVDPAHARVLRDLVVQVAPAQLQRAIKAQPAGTSPGAQLDTVLASTLLTTVPADLTTSTSGPSPVLSGLARIGAISEPSTALRRADLVVLLVSADADPATAARGTALVGELARRSKGAVVLTDGTAGAASAGVVAALRSAAPSDQPSPRQVRPSTVDDAATTTGQVATVLALDAAVRGRAPSDYGTAADATSVLPATGSSGTAPSP